MTDISDYIGSTIIGAKAKVQGTLGNNASIHRLYRHRSGALSEGVNNGVDV